MSKVHKYLARQKYLTKLEREAKKHNYSVSYLTTEPDPGYQRRHATDRWFSHKPNSRGKTRYEYWEKPEINYTLIKRYNSRDYSKIKQSYKRQANKKIRSNYNVAGANYKKFYDIAWQID